MSLQTEAKQTHDVKVPVICGIKNCDTMKRAFAWLDSRKIDYVFHDYKKEGVDTAILERALKQHGWENVLNRKGTTWRALPAKVQEAMNDRQALKTAIDNPSIVRRPLVLWKGNISLGFDEAVFGKIFT